MLRRPPTSTLTDTLFPDTTHFRSISLSGMVAKRASRALASSLSGMFGSRLNLTVFRVFVSFIGFSFSGGNNADAVASHGIHHSQFHRATKPCSSSSAAAHPIRSEEHTSELQSLMRISYAVFCLKK